MTEGVVACGVSGEACAIAARQAMRRIVRGEGEGKEEALPTRWMVALRGVLDMLDDAFSSAAALLRSKVGARKMTLGFAGAFVGLS